MSLTDTRNKMHQEQEGETLAVANGYPVLAGNAAVGDPEGFDCGHESGRLASLLARERHLPEFDPLAVILAGREESSWDDDVLVGVDLPVTPQDSDLLELLCFRVANERYAINIMEIKEIIKPRDITEVPRVQPFISGILSLRGIIIPVFDMRVRLGLEGDPGGNRRRIIVVRKGEEYCGVLVDEVVQVVQIDGQAIEQPPAVLDGIDRDFVGGIGRHDGRMLILLNLDKILDLSIC